ncbi:MAG: hypothetical protein WCO30_01630 [bacterium]
MMNYILENLAPKANSKRAQRRSVMGRKKIFGRKYEAGKRKESYYRKRNDIKWKGCSFEKEDWRDAVNQIVEALELVSSRVITDNFGPGLKLSFDLGEVKTKTTAKAVKASFWNEYGELRLVLEDGTQILAEDYKVAC